VADINKDGWLDIYICNDYDETDYVYINNRDGTYTGPDDGIFTAYILFFHGLRYK